MSTSLSSLIDNLSEIYKKECELCKERKVMSECRLAGLSNNELYYEWKEGSDESYKSINGLNKFYNQCYNLYQFYNEIVNKFVFLLRKGVYPYEYMDNCKKINETSLPDKEASYSKLNKEGITDQEYAHAKKNMESIWNKKSWWV